jgi:micrococcal nuclease
MKLLKSGKAILNTLPLMAIAVFGFLAWQKSQVSTPNRRILASTTHHQVKRVIDGDTIVLENGESVRFCGVDAPEKSQKFGAESTANLKRLIDAADGKVIVADHGRDRYQRIVGEVFAPVPRSQEEKLLDYEQVRAGLAYEYKQYSGKCMNGSVLADAEKLARLERKGIWSDSDDQRPWDYRKQ